MEIGNKKPLMAATVRGGANAKRCEFLSKNRHKYSNLLLIEQTKAKVNADFQTKKMKLKRGRKAESYKNDVQA